MIYICSQMNIMLLQSELEINLYHILIRKKFWNFRSSFFRVPLPVLTALDARLIYQIPSFPSTLDVIIIL